LLFHKGHQESWRGGTPCPWDYVGCFKSLVSEESYCKHAELVHLFYLEHPSSSKEVVWIPQMLMGQKIFFVKSMTTISKIGTNVVNINLQ
jgi:hypothetical protein